MTANTRGIRSTSLGLHFTFLISDMCVCVCVHLLAICLQEILLVLLPAVEWNYLCCCLWVEFLANSGFLSFIGFPASKYFFPSCKLSFHPVDFSLLCRTPLVWDPICLPFAFVSCCGIWWKKKICQFHKTFFILFSTAFIALSLIFMWSVKPLEILFGFWFLVVIDCYKLLVVLLGFGVLCFVIIARTFLKKIFIFIGKLAIQRGEREGMTRWVTP